MKNRPSQLVVDDVLGLLKREEARIRLGESIERVFPYLRDLKASVGSQFAEPAEVMRATLRWLWLAVHANLPPDRIHSVVKSAVERSLNASRHAGGNYFKPDHDVFLIMAGLFTGDSTLMGVVAESVLPADPAADKYQFLEAWSGVLRSRILRERNQEMEQLEVLKRKKGLSSYHCPSPALAEAFCTGDNARFNRCLQKAFSKEWDSLAKAHLLTTLDSGETVVGIAGRSLNHYWPWAEAAFARLAFLDGVKVECDELWLPRRMMNL